MTFDMPSMPVAHSPANRRLSALWIPWLAALLLAWLPPPAAAQWTWRDKAGQVNASDRPPPKDVPEKDILSRPVPEQRPRAASPARAASSVAAPAPASAPPTALEREVQARKRAADLEQATKAKAEEEILATKRGENCRAARNHLTALESGQRIARANDKGEREVLDDQGRAEETRRAREAIASECR